MRQSRRRYSLRFEQPRALFEWSAHFHDRMDRGS